MAEEKYLNLDGLSYYTRKLNSKKANIESPAFTGTPTAPTATTGTNTTQVATTEFVNNAVNNVIKVNSEADDDAKISISTDETEIELLTVDDLKDTVLTGTPTAPTATTGTNTTQIATTEFVQQELNNLPLLDVDTSGEIPLVTVQSGSLTPITLLTTDNLTNIALIGVPTAPTADSGTNTNQIATTEFVQSAITNARHTLTFGKYTYDGSADVTVDTYDGAMNES